MYYQYTYICRLIAEINDVLGDKKEVTAEDVEKLQYTEQVHYIILIPVAM